MAFNYKTEYERYRRYYQSIEPVLKKKESRTYTMAIFSFLAISLFGWYGIRPTLQTILFLQREIADNEEVNMQMEDKITHLVEAQAAYQDASIQFPLIDQAIPQNPEVLSLVSQLKNLAAATGSSLSALQISTVPLLGAEATPSAAGTEGKLTEIPLVIAAVGPYTTIKSFLDGICSMRRIITIATLAVSPSKDEVFGGGKTSTSSGALLRLVTKMNMYYMPTAKKNL